MITSLLSQAVGPKGKVYAVDVAKDFLTHIDQSAAAAGLKNVQTVLCTERSVELPPKSIVKDNYILRFRKVKKQAASANSRLSFGARDGQVLRSAP